MKITHKSSGHWRASQWLLALVTLLTGCGPAAQPSATGRVVLNPASVDLTGDTVELRSQENPQHLAFGQIQPDGSFKIESLIDGKVVTGAPAGTYQARLVISSDDYAHMKEAAKAIPKKFFNFDTSSLLVEVPNHDIQLNITK